MFSHSRLQRQLPLSLPFTEDLLHTWQFYLTSDSGQALVWLPLLSQIHRFPDVNTKELCLFHARREVGGFCGK